MVSAWMRLELLCGVWSTVVLHLTCYHYEGKIETDVGSKNVRSCLIRFGSAKLIRFSVRVGSA